MLLINRRKMATSCVNSYMTFLSRNSLYKSEKPYTTDFPVDHIEGAEVTNHIFDTRPISFKNARVSKEPLALDRNGFCYIKAKTSLQAADATSERNDVMEQYMKEIVGILREKFPQYREIRSMDFQVYAIPFIVSRIHAKMLP